MTPEARLASMVFVYISINKQIYIYVHIYIYLSTLAEGVLATVRHNAVSPWLHAMTPVTGAEKLSLTARTNFLGCFDFQGLCQNYSESKVMVLPVEGSHTAENRKTCRERVLVPLSTGVPQSALED